MKELVVCDINKKTIDCQTSPLPLEFFELYFEDQMKWLC